MLRTSLFWAFLTLTGLFSLSGCGNLVQDVSFDKVPTGQQQLVVQAFISPQDTLLAVYVDQPTSVLGVYNYSSGQRFAIQNAIVDISDGSRTVRLVKRNGPIPPATTSPNLYYGVATREFPVVAGRTYTLTASAPGFPSVTSRCTVPAAVQPTEIRLDSTDRTEYGQPQRVYTAQMTWQDPAGQRNFYRVTGSTLLVYTYRTGSAATSRDTTVFQTRQLNIDGDNELSDQNRDGQRLNVTTSLTRFAANQERARLFSLTLNNLDETMYRFLESIRRQRQQGNNPFSEPILIPSNIQNGLGCFGAYNQATLTIRAKQ